jgi:hypothetical protein
MTRSRCRTKWATSPTGAALHIAAERDFSLFGGLSDFLGEYRPKWAADHCAVTVTIPKLLHLVEFHYEY